MNWVSRHKTAMTIAMGLVAFAWASPAPAQDRRDMMVSLVQLIANPSLFDAKRVIVKGYVVMEFEGQALYLSEADAKHGITRNGVWLDVSEAIYATRDRFHQRFVRVEGTFNAQRRGHLGLFSGTIENIVRLELLE